MDKQLLKINQLMASFEGRRITPEFLGAAVMSVNELLWHAILEERRLAQTHHGRAALARRERKESMRLWFYAKHRCPRRFAKRFYPRVIRCVGSAWFEE